MVLKSKSSVSSGKWSNLWYYERFVKIDSRDKNMAPFSVNPTFMRGLSFGAYFCSLCSYSKTLFRLHYTYLHSHEKPMS